MSDERLMIFAKAPETGRAKTRLIPALGAEGAARMHGCFTRDVVERHTKPGRGLTLWRAGRLDHPIWAELGGSQEDQRDGDLGARMHAAFERSFETADRVVVLGTDSPSLPPAFVDQAFAALERVPVVLGPACDGGYYLLGLREAQAALFREIDWGTGSVLVQTLRQIEALGLCVELLPFWYDVDRPADLELLRAHAPIMAKQGVPLPRRAIEALTR